MPSHTLARLIASYQWLAEEHAEQKRAGAALNARHVAAELNDAFLRIVRFPAEEPQVCRLQIDFLVTMLAEPGHDAGVRALLRDAALAHVERLTNQMHRARKDALRQG